MIEMQDQQSIIVSQIVIILKYFVYQSKNSEILNFIGL